MGSAPVRLLAVRGAWPSRIVAAEWAFLSKGGLERATVPREDASLSEVIAPSPVVRARRLDRAPVSQRREGAAGRKDRIGPTVPGSKDGWARSN